MEPPVTNWPENTLMPSRWELESRPFLELPKPFLCAIRNISRNSLSRLSDYLLNLYSRIVLTMADRELVLLLALEFKDNNLVAPPMSRNCAAHTDRLEHITENHLVGIVRNHKDWDKVYRAAVSSR